jgi:ABC-type branched-subunit amino acid transport system substrate-binding protein
VRSRTQRRFGQWGVLGVAAIASVLAVTGCSSSTKSSNSPSTTAAPSGSTSPAGGTSPAGSTQTQNATGSAIKIGVLNESTGEFGAQFGPLVPGVQAWASWVNSHGGLNGHRVTLNIYNNASSPSQVVANAHLAVSQGAVALIDSDPLFDAASTYLQSVGIPVYAFGITPGFFGSDKTNFFSYTGNPIDGKTTSSIKFLVAKGKTKFALLSDPSPADSAGIKSSLGLVKSAGGTIVYTNYNVDPTNTASLLAVAKAVKDSGAQVVSSAAGGTEAQFQADLAQVGGGDIWVSNGSDYQQNLPKQFGSALNNYTFFFFTAPFTVPTPGMQNYLAAMAKSDPKDEYNFQSLVGWASATLLAGGVQALGNQPVTRQSLTAATNSLQNYTGDGVLAPVSFPLFHTAAPSCLAFVQVQNGNWVQLSGTPSSPFYCSAPLP